MSRFVPLLLLASLLAGCAKGTSGGETPGDGRVKIVMEASVGALTLPSAAAPPRTCAAAMARACGRAGAPAEGASKLSLESGGVVWDAGDRVIMRFGNTTYSGAADCESVCAVAGGAEARFEGTAKYAAGQQLYCFYSKDGGFVNNNGIVYGRTVSGVQTGRQADIKDNALLYSLVKQTDMDITYEGGAASGLSFRTSMAPFFSLVRLTVPKSLKVTAVTMTAESDIAGQLRINIQKTYGTIKGADSQWFLERTAGEKSITATQGGEVLDEEVYFTVIPDAYDAAAGEYFCSTAGLKFTFTNSDGDTVSFSRVPDKKIYCGSSMDMGTVPDTLDFRRRIGIALKFKDGANAPAVVPDSAGLAESLAALAHYHFLTSGDGFGAMGEPTEADPQIGADGIVIPVTQKSDRIYIKVLGTGNRLRPVRLRAIVRNWKFDKNFICPTALVTQYDGLTLNLSAQYSSSAVADGRIGYLGCNKGSATVSPELAGTGACRAAFFGGSFATTFSISKDGGILYSIAMPSKQYFYDNAVCRVQDAGTVGPATTLRFDWNYKMWLMDFSLLEQQTYRTASDSSAGTPLSGEEYEDNTEYAL